MTRSTRPALLALALAFSTSTTWAIGEFSSTKATGSAKLCPQPLTQLCAGAFVEQAADGGFLRTSATVAMSAPNMALHSGVDFFALAQYNPAVFDLPVLKAFAAADTTVGYLTNASAQAAQAYTYTGAVSKTFTLLINVDGILRGQDNEVFGGVAAYAEDYLDGTFGDGPGTLLTNPVSFSLRVTGSSSKSFSFTLDPGRSVYLDAFVFATARSTRGPSVADAANTMTMRFLDPTGLVLAQPVPEASTLSMLGAGLAMMAWLVNTRRRPLGGHA
jgi:hypothetical protein